MDIPTPKSDSMSSANVPARRAAVLRSTKTKRRLLSYLPFCGLLLAALLVGAVVGALIVRQRHRTQDIMVAANGAVINRENFFRRLQSVSGDAVMRQMLNEELLLQYARQQHVYPSETQVEAEYRKMSKEALQQALTFQSPEDVKRSLRLNLIGNSLLSKDITVTPQEIQAYYKAQSDRRNPKARFYTPQTATIAVIVTATEAQGKAAEHEIASGIPFETVARHRSQDNSKQNGGVLAPIRYGQTQGKAPDLEAAIFSMKIGQQIGPRNFLNAWWIIRCLDRTTEVVQPFADVSEECRLGALLQKGVPKNVQSSTKNFNEFKRKADVTVFWPSYADSARKR